MCSPSGIRINRFGSFARLYNFSLCLSLIHILLLLGALMGTLAGVLRGVFNVPSFVATLGLWLSLIHISPAPQVFTEISDCGFLFMGGSIDHCNGADYSLFG